MKKIIKIGTAVLLTLTPAVALAQIIPPCPTDNPTCHQNLIELITKISDTLLLLVGVVAVLFIIIGGFQYITSAGNPENVSKAKNTILYAVIGIIVTLLAYGIVRFIVDALSKQ